MKKVYTFENRTFECHVNPIGGALIEVSVWEVVRPTWIAFRTKYMDTLVFCDTEYPSITVGVLCVIDRCLQKERVEKKRAAKWKEFERS